MRKSREQIKEYREQLAEQFLKVLEERPLTWEKDWKAVDVPRNGTSGHVYRGINRLNLTLVSMARGYQDSRWMTYHQIQKKGWKLRNAKGQGVKVEYWFPYDRENKKYMTWEEFRAAEEDFGNQYQLLASYKTVFNGDLVEGIPEREKEEKEPVEVSDLVNKIQKNMGVGLYHDGIDRAYYDPGTDTVHLPRPEAFQTAYGYHATIFHELTHATGATHRLDRDLSHGYGAPEYAFEELVAEISACFFSANLDMEPEDLHIQNHQAYVQSWAKRIKDRPESLVEAVRQAEKAAGYLEYQAELIKEKEYQKVLGSSLAVKDQDLERDDKRKEFEQEIPSPQKMSELKAQKIMATVNQGMKGKEGFSYVFDDRGYIRLNEAEARAALRYGLRVDLISAQPGYHGSDKGLYDKISLNEKNIDKFYTELKHSYFGEKGLRYGGYNRTAYLSPDYEKLDGIDQEQIHQALTTRMEAEQERGLFQGQKREKKSALQSCMERTAQQKVKRVKSREQGR